MSNVDWAIQYAKRGMHVFPVGSNKRPFAGTRGLNDATTDLETIRRWWTDRPHANIALNCGASGIVVVDIDTKNGKVGAHSLYELIGDETHLLETLRSTTWSGGQHLFFRGQCASSISEIAPDIDIKGDGGYVVLPPSIVSEGDASGTYRWQVLPGGEKIEMSPFPEVFRLGATSAKVPIREIAEKITARRNDELNRMAGWYRRFGMSIEEVAGALHAVNRARCVPPLPDDEVDGIARKSARYAPAMSMPPRNGGAPVRTGVTVQGGGALLSGAELIARSNVEATWAVEGLVQSGGMILLTARPKVGKSEFARSMSKAVATGTAFLGRRTRQARVLWIGLAESEGRLIEAASTMGMLDLGITWVTSSPQGAWQPWLEDAITQSQAGFVVIDEIGRLATDIENANDYSQVVRATQPLIDLRNKLGVTFCLIHHQNKTGGTMGSTAWDGAVDCIVSLTRDQSQTRTMQTTQRVGDDIEPTIITRDPNTGEITCTVPRVVLEQQRAEQHLLTVLADGIPRTRYELACMCSAGCSIGRRAVDQLLADGCIQASGAGTRGNPRKYAISTPGNARNDLGQAPSLPTHSQASSMWSFPPGFPDTGGSGVLLPPLPQDPMIKFDTGGKGYPGYFIPPGIPHESQEYPEDPDVTPSYPGDPQEDGSLAWYPVEHDEVVYDADGNILL